MKTYLFLQFNGSVRVLVNRAAVVYYVDFDRLLHIDRFASALLLGKSRARADVRDQVQTCVTHLNLI